MSFLTLCSDIIFDSIELAYLPSEIEVLTPFTIRAHCRMSICQLTIFPYFVLGHMELN